MSIVKKQRKKFNYNVKRYWYHISSKIEGTEVLLTPIDNESGCNRCEDEPDVKRTCVAPTISQCLTAVPYHLCETFNVYRTKNRVLANKPYGVFDACVTHEGWIQRPIKFIKIGELSLNNVETFGPTQSLIEEVASSGEVSDSRRGLRWWNKVNPENYIEYVKK